VAVGVVLMARRVQRIQQGRETPLGAYERIRGTA
jgi:hypothetical protein